MSLGGRGRRRLGGLGFSILLKTSSEIENAQPAEVDDVAGGEAQGRPGVGPVRTLPRWDFRFARDLCLSAHNFFCLQY